MYQKNNNDQELGIDLCTTKNKYSQVLSFSIPVYKRFTQYNFQIGECDKAPTKYITQKIY